ncbi:MULTISPECIES: HEPN domain-containing protein [Natrialbaceae]|uniref:HEPN domain-containing protein n=1 Tax=Natrialbaceae TaxID=1644061 RepID=UPI00207CB3F3|nr:HEPN domain-containing protein [Natronococcus sp. CG52]
MNQEFTDDLYAIIDDIEDTINENIDGFPEVEVTYWANNCDKYDYDEVVDTYMRNGGSSGNPVKLSQEKDTKVKIPREAKHENTISIIEESDQYQNVLDILQREMSERNNNEATSQQIPSYSEERPESLLSKFVTVVVDEIIESESGEIGNKKRANLISSFNREIEKPLISYNMDIFFYGIACNFESTELENGMNISQTSSSDLEYRTHLDRPMIMNLRLAPVKPPTLKLSYDIKSEDMNTVYKEIDIISALLRLYSVSTATVIGHDINAQSPLRRGTQRWVDANRNYRFVSTLEDGDQEHINNFMEVIERRFREEIMERPNQNHLTIAHDRYESALTGDSTESAIASTIMSLEALYLKENEKGELSERLAQRTGMLLSCLDYQPMEVYSKIKKGYSVRSSYVHGTKTTDNFSDKLSIRTASFARKSMIMFLQMKSEYEKEELISKLDNAIMSPNARQQFEEDLDEICGYKPLKSH